MKVYHIFTREPDESSLSGLDHYDLHSIYSPQSVLVGFVKRHYKNGLIVNYGQPYAHRAQAIVDRKKSVRGEVIAKVDLDPGAIVRIAQNHSRAEVLTLREFDGSTDCLVKILTGELVIKNNLFQNIASLAKELVSQ